jgi:hypothetical protein
MLAIVCNASFSTTCPRKPNSIQNASVLTNFLSEQKLRNSQVICKTPSTFRGWFSICDLLVVGQNRAYSFRNVRNCEDAAQRLQRFVHWEVSFEETFHPRFAVLALNVHGLRRRSKPCRFSPGW